MAQHGNSPPGRHNATYGWSFVALLPCNIVDVPPVTRDV